MRKEELRLHHDNILSLIHQIQIETADLTFDEFRQNEPLKERIFSQLQEIGQASREIMDTTNPFSEDEEIADVLAVFRNARFNMEAEVAMNSVWAIVKNDLPVVEELLTTKVRIDEEEE